MWNALKHLNVSQRWMLKSNISHDFDGWNPGVPPTCKPCVANHVHKFHVKPMASPSRFPKCWISKRKSTRQILATNDMPIDSQLIPNWFPPMWYLWYPMICWFLAEIHQGPPGRRPNRFDPYSTSPRPTEESLAPRTQEPWNRSEQGAAEELFVGGILLSKDAVMAMAINVITGDFYGMRYIL